MTDSNRMCVVCHARVGIYLSNRACRACTALTAAEGTREQFGLPKPRNPARQRADFIRIWNKMRAEGATIEDIAARMGRCVQTVKNVAQQLRKDGYQLEESHVQLKRRRKPEKPISRDSLTSHRANEHGGGKGGITKCKCEPCLTRRRAYRAEWNRNNQDKVRTSKRRHDTKKNMPS